MDDTSHGHLDLVQSQPDGEAPYVAATFFDCVAIDSADCIDFVNARGINPNDADAQGLTPLYGAVAIDARQAAARLLALGADPRKATPRGDAVAFALAAGTPEMIELLVTKDRAAAEAALLAAITREDAALLELALRLDADPDAEDPAGLPAVALAAASGNAQAVRRLVRDGAKLEPRGPATTHPLGLAIASGVPEAVQAVVTSGVDPNMTIGDLLPLELAAVQGDPDVVEALIATGASLDQKTASGQRAADFAAALGRDDLAELLGGVSPPQPSILEVLADNGSGNKIREALANGADPNSRTPEGAPAVVAAAALGRGDSVRALVEGGADLTAVSPDGVGVLAAALGVEPVERRNPVVAAVLAAAKRGEIGEAILLQRDQSGRSAVVLLAARWMQQLSASSDSMMNSLVSEKAIARMANEPDPDGVTPYLAAVLADNVAMVHYLSRSLKVEPAQIAGQPSLQDLARAREAWGALAVLPDDRPLPEDLRHDASQAERAQALRDLQAALKAWGYYAGEVDGAFGPGSRAALGAFLADRKREVLGATKALANSPFGGFEIYPNAEPGNVSLRADLYKVFGCDWTVLAWRPDGEADSTEYVGCRLTEKAGNAWNANSFARVRYGAAGDSAEVVLLGPDGWESAISLFSVPSLDPNLAAELQTKIPVASGEPAEIPVAAAEPEEDPSDANETSGDQSRVIAIAFNPGSDRATGTVTLWPGETKAYSFEARENQRLTVEVDPTPDEVEAEVRVLDANGRELTKPITHVSQTSVALSGPGPFMVEFYRALSASGNESVDFVVAIR